MSRKIFNRTYRRFTEELLPVETVTHVSERRGMVYVESFGGSHPFLRKPGPSLAEYAKLGYPFGKSRWCPSKHNTSQKHQ